MDATPASVQVLIECTTCLGLASTTEAVATAETEVLAREPETWGEGEGGPN